MQGKSTEKLENGLFSCLAVDLYDKHEKCAYAQAQKQPFFVLRDKHTSPPPQQLTQRRHRGFHSSFVHSTQRRIPQVAEFVVLVP